jgi:glycosyltransferase involved in cell wall biosynthesis
MDMVYVTELVSVIVPTYNRSKLIGETLDSVFAQTYRPIEILVIDDGSTDNTEEEVKSYFNKCDDQVKLIYIPKVHTGAQEARNIGYQQSQGEYIQFLDSDDILSKYKIQMQVNVLRNCEMYSFAYGPWRCLYTGENNSNKFGSIAQKKGMSSEDSMLRGYLSGRWYCPIHSYLFRRNLTEKAGPWDIELSDRQDTDYLVQVLLNKPKALHVPESLVFYRRHHHEHIGSPKNFKSNFAANLFTIEKWSNQLKNQNNFRLYEGEFIESLYCLADAATSMDYNEGPALCYDMMVKIIGSAPDDLVKPDIKRKSGIFARKYLVRPIRKYFGESNIIWIDTIIKSLLKL